MRDLLESEMSIDEFLEKWRGKVPEKWVDPPEDVQKTAEDIFVLLGSPPKKALLEWTVEFLMSRNEEERKLLSVVAARGNYGQIMDALGLRSRGWMFSDTIVWINNEMKRLMKEYKIFLEGNGLTTFR